MSGTVDRVFAALCLGVGILALSATLVAGAAAEVDDDTTDWEEVISRLTHEVRRMPRHAATRKQLAVAHNNYAVSLAGQGEWQLATHHLEEAIRLDAQDGQFRTNLASVHLSRAYEEYADHRFRQAHRALEDALDIDPELAAAYVLLGEIEYNTQRLPQAKAAWERALNLDPSLAEITRRLAQLNEELPVESQFGRISRAYFDLRYEEGMDRPVGFDLQSVLLQARRLVGSDFAYWPNYTLVVLIYTGDSFRALRQETPEWLAGQYDGKIRVPLPNDELDLDTVKQILFHEYTHALVHDLTDGRCPTWFNEGLAEYEGARHGTPHLEQLAAAVSSEQLLPWEQLDLSFSKGRPVEEIALGYQQSHSIVRYLVEHYGFWRVRQVLKAVKAGTPLARVLESEFHITRSRLESNWRAWLPRFLSRH